MKFRYFVILMVAGAAISIGCKSDENYDEAIQTEVMANLNNRPAISATVKDGVVTLTGECPDQDCRSNSEDAVKKIDHVKKVVNNIAIVAATSNAGNDNNSEDQISSDENLTNSVNNVVKNYSNVHANVEHGIITLRSEINRGNLQELLIKLNELHPKQVINQLAIE